MLVGQCEILYLYACAVRIVYYENSWLIGVCKDSGGNSAENIPVYSKFPKIINDSRNRVFEFSVLQGFIRLSTLTPSLVFPGDVFTVFRTTN